MLHFLFSNETNFAVPKVVFAKIVAGFEKVLMAKVREVLGCENGEVSLILVNDQKIKLLNSKYRKKNKPTDVLSFAYTEGKRLKGFEKSPVQAGDIFISLDTARKQADEHKHGLKKELGILFTHGLLHLFGFDHGNDKEEAEMGKWVDKILKHVL